VIAASCLAQLIRFKKSEGNTFGSAAIRAWWRKTLLNSMGNRNKFFLKKTLADSTDVDILAVFLRNAKEWTAQQK